MNPTVTKLMALGALAWLIAVPAATAASSERALTKRDMAVLAGLHSEQSSGTAVDSATRSRAPVAPEGTQLLPNGDFEQGQTVWTEFSQNGWDIISNSGFPSPVLPYGGSWLAWLGGDFDEISYIEQQVMVPALTSSLIYWEWIKSDDLCDFDFATVTMNGSTLVRYSLCEDDNTLGWVLRRLNIASYAGQTVTLRIHVDTDDTWNSNLFVDDVSFEVADGLFSDGFESGDTSAWSDSSP